MEEKRRTKTLSDQGKLKTRNTGNHQSKSDRRRQDQSISGKESVDTTEQVLARETLQQSLVQARRGQQMVLTLSQAAQSIALAHTLEDVYHAIQEQSSRLGYQATELELTSDRKLRITLIGYKPSLIRKAEKLTGFSQSDYLFSPRKGSIYQRVLFQGETIYLQNITQAIADALPSKMRKLARQIANILGLAPAIFAPLKIGEEMLGILALTGPDLTEADNPAIAAFACQTAITMQNARLYEAAQKEIAEYKRTEESLRESEEKFRKAFLTNPDSININRLADGKFVSINNGFSQIMGYSVEEAIGKTSIELNIWVDPEDRKKLIDGLLKKGEVVNLEARFRAKNGELHDGLMSASVIELDNVPHIISITRDITERKQMEEALRQSEEKYRELIDGMTETVWVIDFNGNIIDVNKTALEVLGYSKEELLTVGLSGIDASLTKEKIVALAGAMSSEKTQTFETLHTTKDGRTFPVEVHSSLITYQGKRAILSIARDITERKRTAEALAQERNLLRSLIDNVPDYIYAKDLQSRFIIANTALAHLVGTSTPDELLGKTDFDFFPQELAAKYYADEQALFQSGQALLGHEEPTLDNAGNPRWASTTKVPLRNENGDIFGLVGMGREITEHKQAEAALEKERSLLRALIDNIPDKIYFKDLESHFILINHAQARTFGLSDPAQVIGKTDFDFFTEEHARPAYENEQAIIQTGQPMVDKEEKETWPDGRVGWALTTKMPLRDEKGNIIGTFGISRDITERKQVEAELRESEQRFRQLFVASPDALMLIDPYDPAVAWPIVDCNEIACQMNGYTRDELIGKSVDILNATEGTPQERTAYLELIKRSGVFHLESLHRHRDGHTYPVEISTTIVKFKGRELILGIDRDITERKQAEEALAASEAELRALFASMQDVVLVIDREGVYREIAPTDPGLLYKPPQELLGQNLRDVFTAEQAETFINVICQTLDTGQTAHIEYELTIGENPIWFSASISPMDADSTLWVARDITEQKQAVTEIRRRAEEFAVLYDTSMNLSAEHDLNSLLQTIVENATTMLHAYAGGMYLYDPVCEELEVMLATEPSMPVGTRLRLGEGVAGRIAQSHQSMRIDDYSTWEGRSQKYESVAVRATIEVPMLYKGELIGVLVAHEIGASERKFTEADEHLLSLFAFQAAAAIQNARLFEQERTRAQELSTLYEATKTISSDLALESVLETVSEKMAQISHSDGCTLSLLNHEQDAVITLVDHRSKHPDRAESKDVIYHLKEYPASRRVLESGQPLTIDLKDKEADQWELAYMTKRGITTLLILPLIAHNQVIGLVEIYEEERERTYKQEEIYLLQHLAAQAAISIENARLFEDAQRRLRQTTALREIDQAITGSVEFQRVLKVVLKHTISELGVDAAAILLYDPEEKSLHYEIGNGFLAESLQHTHLKLGQGYAGRAALGKQTIYIQNLQVRNTDFLRSPTFHQEGFICYFGVPLIAKGEIKGVLEIFHRTPLNPDIEWLSFMETLAGQIAIAIDNATLYKNLQRSNEELSLAYDATIEGWSRALDLRDRETEGHTLRVTELTVEMAAEMGMSKEELVHIRRGALLHDIGKMGVPDRILLKPDTLTNEEWKIMQKHPIFAYEMLSPISFLRPALDIPYCHHERWDGTGYPRKLKGDEIPIVARIFAVVDVWDALTSNRPYRPAWTKEQALEHIQEQPGKHFDPKVVEVFLKLIAEE